MADSDPRLASPIVVGLAIGQLRPRVLPRSANDPNLLALQRDRVAGMPVVLTDIPR